MKHLLTTTVAAVVLAAFATSTFAGSCGSCPSGDKEKGKDKDKTEEAPQT